MNDTEDHTVDLVIVNYNTYAYLKRCIASIKKYTNHPYRLIVIDNASTDQSREYLKKLQQQGITVLYNHSNLGTSRAWNQGIRLGRGRYILFLNPDICVTPHWLEKLVAYARSDPRIGVVGCKQVDQHGKIIYAGIIQKGDDHIFRGRGEEDHPGKFNQVCDCASVSGSCYLIKRENIPRIGYFDERFFMYAEESDYSLRARLAGFRVIYAPVTITHYREGTPIDPEKRRQLRLESDRLFREKWHGSVDPLEQIIGSELEEIARSPQALEKCQLIKGEEPAVYIVYKNRKHLITSTHVFQKLKFRWEDVKVLSQKEVDKIMTGRDLQIRD